MNPVPPPGGPLVQPTTGAASRYWVQWWTDLRQMATDSPRVVVSPVSLTGQGSSIATTNISPGQVAAGLYRLSYYARVTGAAFVSSSLVTTLGWTDHGQALTVSGPGLTANDVTIPETLTVMAYLDALTPITYETSYASVGAVTMVYELYVTLESVAI